MNIKTNAIFLLLGLVVGFIITTKLSNKPESQAIIKEVEKKSGQVNRKITQKPDGTKHISEVETYESETKHESTAKLHSKHNSAGLIYKYDFSSQSHGPAAFYAYKGIGIYGSKHEIGVILTLNW